MFQRQLQTESQISNSELVAIKTYELNVFFVNSIKGTSNLHIIVPNLHTH